MFASGPNNTHKPFVALGNRVFSFFTPKHEEEVGKHDSSVDYQVLKDTLIARQFFVSCVASYKLKIQFVSVILRS